MEELLLDSIGTLRIAREYITISTPETEPTSPAPKGMTTPFVLLLWQRASLKRSGTLHTSVGFKHRVRAVN